MNLIEFIKHPAYNYYITTLVHDCLLSDLTIVTEYPCKIINLTYEDKIVSKENKTQDNKVFI